jgi:hypothetical protein
MANNPQKLKDQLLNALREARAEILKQAASLSPADHDTVFLGIWSIKDMLAHLAGWDFTNLEAVRDVLAGKVPVFYDHYDHDWQSYNAALVAKYKRDTMEEMLALLQDSHRQLLELADGLPAEVFPKDYGLRAGEFSVTIQRLLEAGLKDELVHSQEIDDYFQQPK